MEKEVDIVALGELLIDFTEAGYGKDGMKLFEQNPGGAPANLLTVASHMGPDIVYWKSRKRHAWCIFKKNLTK